VIHYDHKELTQIGNTTRNAAVYEALHLASGNRFSLFLDFFLMRGVGGIVFPYIFDLDE